MPLIPSSNATLGSCRPTSACSPDILALGMYGGLLTKPQSLPSTSFNGSNQDPCLSSTNQDNFLWQSFDYPCHTFLPKMKIGWDLVTGLDRYLSSWKSTEDPAPGEFLIRMDYRGLPQLLMKGAKIQARAGSWNSLYLTGLGYGVREPNPISGTEFVLNKDEVYFEYSLRNMSVFSRFVLKPLGVGEQFPWVYQTELGTCLNIPSRSV